MRGHAFRDADDGRDAGVDGLVDRVGREGRRHEDHRGVRSLLRHGLCNGVEDGHPFDVLAALARRHARDEVRAVGAVAEAVEAALRAGQALDDEASVVVDDDRHQAGTDLRTGDPVEDDVGSSDAVTEELDDALGLLAFAATAVEPRLQLDRLLEEAAPPPRAGPPPRGRRASPLRRSCARARDRGASRPPRRPHP